jgi:hypothetical protein
MENWDNMTPNEQGRHCTSCNKTVVDFSLFSDRQIIEFFSKATDRICGSYNPLQVGREIRYSEPQNHFLYRLLFGTIITTSVGCSDNSNYNMANKSLTEQYIPIQASLGNDTRNKETESLPGTDSIHYVEGKIYWEGSTTGIQGVNVSIFSKIDSKLWVKAITNKDGYFKAKISEKSLMRSLVLTAQGTDILRSVDFIIDKFPYTVNVGVTKLEYHPIRLTGDTIVMPIDSVQARKNRAGIK